MTTSTFEAPEAGLHQRRELAEAKRIVVKVGSSSLTSIKGGISEKSLTALVNALAVKRNAGAEIILVSSGAIAAGLAPLGLAKRPKDLATQQAAASVGQGLLMARYTQAFNAHGVTVSQVLLTADDLMRRTQHTNAFRALNRLLNLGVVPVVNENDTVATHEIRFGDNDRLAALVAHLVRADALVLLSDVDAVYDGPPAHGAKRISLVRGAQDLEGITIGKAGKAGVGTGGMMTKVEAASIAASSGIHALVTSTANAAAALAGEDVGTWFAVNGNRKPVRLLWLAHLATVRGRLVLDDGAVKAVRDRHRSLLPAGISNITGEFEAGDPVEMVGLDGTVVARGLVNYSSEELPRMLGRTTQELGQALGRGYDREVVHVDDLVLVRAPRSSKLGA
ncbi:MULTISPECIES: glutamate 5-kinase [Paenarthrobacter]|jgi:glutamate 5-kinase|uniref:glutamate 5-kinase n=1 Tax=Paenarthrobacter TaxID=1742992 RepID=UPI00140CF31E|nr:MULTISPECIES: glutamate 5-kinase [Paenarthrobacter]MCX8453041.1 glutamate 5-kinase [Paenarthrobacter ureafaciens]MCY0971679.1 glutamate 5-kinase [Paenarthrobacter ureafaciens]QOT16909.1 glutamate 5-kinase [Paenarthrobacter sp. YJN-5]